MTPERAAAAPGKRKRGVAALEVMEQHLRARAFFVGEPYSIADIALYAYTHVAPEGGFDLAPFPALRAWLERVAAQPGYIRHHRLGCPGGARTLRLRTLAQGGSFSSLMATLYILAHGMDRISTRTLGGLPVADDILERCGRLFVAGGSSRSWSGSPFRGPAAPA